MDTNKRVFCPNCKKRLFDTDNNSEGDIFIKCDRCRAILKIRLKKNEQNEVRKVEITSSK